MNFKHRWLPLSAAVFLMAVVTASAQPAANRPAWKHLPTAPPEKAVAERWVLPLRGELFEFDESLMKASLAKVRVSEPGNAAVLGTEVALPMPDGTTARFKVVDAPVMAPELAAQFPEIKTYAGQGIDDPAASIRMDITPAGLHAQILSPQGAVYVDPAYRGDARYHVSYFKRDYRKLVDEWACRVVDRELGVSANGTTESDGVVLAKVQSGSTLRTYRLACAATGEYTAYHGGTVALGQAAIVTAINRVNQVFEAELAVRLVLVPNNSLLVYTNSGTDPYTNDDGVAMLQQNQDTIDSIIGSANYDIGHVFSTGGGGIASWQSVCSSTRKAKGVTGLLAPIGDPFYIDFVCHEVGHQFGGDHTFNSETGSCSGGNRNASTAFEPGSGSTIMAYAGICPPNDLQAHSDPYFHAGSLDQIQSFLSGTGGTCAVNSGTGNSAPTVSAGADYAIPAQTPFALTATASDSNGDPITYCWEQMDTGAAAALGAADDGTIPLFRSLKPTNSPVRYFPELSSVLANTNWNQEKLPVQSRTMDMRVTVRDNRAGGGGVADDDMQITVVGSAGPFVVTSPNTAVAWSGARTVTWNVAGTTAAPINASGVNILLSTNGGSTFSFLLATNVPNNGSASVVLPNLNTAQARIMVQGAGNIFYDVSDVNFSISPGSPVPLIQTAGFQLLSESCTPTNGMIDPYETVTVNWSLINVGTAPTTNLTATLLASNGIYFPSGPQVYGVIAAGGTVSRSFTFTPAGDCGGSVTGLLQLADSSASMGTVSQLFALGGGSATVTTQVFNSATSITINDYSVASPYPSTISVSNVSGTVAKAIIKLNSLSHGEISDVDVLAVGPNGEAAMLMSYVGSGFSSSTISFDDSAGGDLPFFGGIPTGTYLPTDYLETDEPPGAPSRPYTTNVNDLATIPNGTWSLYVVDYNPAYSGSISGGWTLSLVTSNFISSCATNPPPRLAGITTSNNAIHFSWLSAPGLQYQVQSRTNLTSGTWMNFGPPFLGTGGLLSTNDTTAGDWIRFYRVVLSP